MVKRQAKKPDEDWFKWAVVAFLVATVATNAYWYTMFRDLNNRIDNQTQVILELSTRLNK